MAPEDLIKYIENPEKLDKSSLKLLSDNIDQYPYFQTLRLLYIKNLQNVNHQVEKTDLNLTAAFVTDRKVLYYLLYKIPQALIDENVNEDKKVKLIGAIEKDIKDTMQENISETISNQLDYMNLADGVEIELIPGLAIDVRKQYGEGITLEDRLFSLTGNDRKNIRVEESLLLLDEDANLEELALTDTGLEVKDDAEQLFEFDEELEVNSSTPEIILKNEIKDEILAEQNKEAAKVEEKNNIDDLQEKDLGDHVGKDDKSFTEWLNIVDHKTSDSQLNEPVHNKKNDIKPKEEEEPGERENEPREMGNIEELPIVDESESDKKIPNIEPQTKHFQVSLIDKFIHENPRIVPVDPSVQNEDISVDSVKEHESFITDTLAQIYVKQGNYAKAIFAYEKLSLKYPEKSTYFAGQIAEIKKLINKK